MNHIAEIWSSARITHPQYALKFSALYNVLQWTLCCIKMMKRNWREICFLRGPLTTETEPK